MNVKKIIRLFWGKIIGSRSSRSVPKRIYDVFNTEYEKKAMLSYVTSPFENLQSLHRTHTNVIEAKSWAEELHRRKFRVDVFNYNDTAPIDNLTDYVCHCGFGVPLESALNMRSDRETTFIFYGTGCHHAFSDRETIKRKISFRRKYGRWPNIGGREIGFSWPLQMLSSDYYVALGNKFVAETYRKNILTGQVLHLSAFYLNDPSTIQFKIFTEKNRNNLLWFGSNGAIHKGLITALESLRQLPDVTLHIAGLAECERRELELDEIFADLKDRVIYHGFVHVDSDLFQNIINKCGIVVYPSASEGGAANILTSVANGAGIPILTRATGVDRQDLAIIMESGTVEEVVSAIRMVRDMPVTKYVAWAGDTQRYYARNYTIGRYQKALTRIFDEIGTGSGSIPVDYT